MSCSTHWCFQIFYVFWWFDRKRWIGLIVNCLSAGGEIHRRAGVRETGKSFLCVLADCEIWTTAIKGDWHVNQLIAVGRMNVGPVHDDAVRCRAGNEKLQQIAGASVSHAIAERMTFHRIWTSLDFISLVDVECLGGKRVVLFDVYVFVCIFVVEKAMRGGVNYGSHYGCVG